MSFDHLAPWYDLAEWATAGTLLQRARTTWLDALDGRRAVLTAGEGHGRFAAACLARHPEASLTYLDASVGMMRVARRRLDRQRQVAQWIQADATDWNAPVAAYDAIATHFFLDCFDPASLTRVIDRLAGAATHDAVWLVTDFAIPDRGLTRWRARAMHAVMYAVFRRTTALSATRVTPPDALLRAHGFELAGRREYSLGLVRADLWRR